MEGGRRGRVTGLSSSLRSSTWESLLFQSWISLFLGIKTYSTVQKGFELGTKTG